LKKLFIQACLADAAYSRERGLKGCLELRIAKFLSNLQILASFTASATVTISS
jgi:hypothetical protein